MKTASMKLFSAISLLHLCAGVSAPGAGPPPEKTVSAVLLSAVGEASWNPGLKTPEKKFRIRLGFSVPVPGKIVDCRKEGFLLDIRDSTGSGRASRGYDHFMDSGTPEVTLEMEHWTPSPEASWVSVKGNVPLMIAEKEVMSEGVLFSMDKKKEKQSLVLKGGALADDGRQGDVKTALEIRTWSPNRNSGKIRLEVNLKSPCVLGISEVTLIKPDGAPVLGRRGWGHSSASDGSSEWQWHYDLEPGEKGKVQVFVSYMSELKLVNVPVEMKFSLSGMVRETSGQ